MEGNYHEMPPKQAAKKKNNAYKMPDPIKQGEVLEDISKRKWQLGPSIGKGGFGEIYSALDAAKPSKDYQYVIKIEPHTNGPLFVEMHFYMKLGKPNLVEEFQKKYSLKTFGMPLLYGSGSHEYENEKYRFLVIDKLGKDLWQIFVENGKKFSVDTVFKLGVQIVYVLEYIHDSGYIHADIKGANLLFGTTKQTSNQIYLVDFGLASKYTTLKDFKPNPKKAHDGTIEYLSRDAHKGVQTMRGDLEILGYNMVRWLGCKLPWENVLTNVNAVHDSKTKSMNDIPGFLKQCFGSRSPPDGLIKFLQYVNSLAHNTTPDYKKIRDMFTSEIKKAGGSLDAPFNFEKSTTSSETKRASLKRKSTGRLSFVIKKAKSTPVKRIRKVATTSSTTTETEENHNKVPIKVSSPKTAATKRTTKKTVSKDESKSNDYDGYTPEMIAIMEKMKKNGAKVKRKNKTVSKVTNGLDAVNSPEGYNAEMKSLHKKLLIKKVGVKKAMSTAKSSKNDIEKKEADASPGTSNGFVTSRRKLRAKQ